METISESAQQLIDETVQSASKLQGKVTFTGNPVKLFGIIFNHGYPLEVSLTKYCFQGCPFCFATANKRANKDVIGKQEDPTDMVIKLFEKANGQGFNPQSIKEYLVREKYPIIFSNNVDPFMPASEYGFRLGERILKAALYHKQPLFIQTKEVYTPNTPVRDLLIEGKDQFMMYVSISTSDYETAKRYETVTPTPDERFKRIEDLTKNGVKVCVALNPYVSEWQPNLREYFKRVKDSGAVGVFTYPLHLTTNQKKVMPKRMGEFATTKVNRMKEFYEDTKIMEQLASEFGLGLEYPERFPDTFYKANALGFKTWPIDAQRFMEVVHATYAREKMAVQVKWADVDAFYRRFKEWEMVFNMNEFAGVMWTDNDTFFQVRNALGTKNKLKNIVRFIWNNPDICDQFFNFYLGNRYLVEREDGDSKEFIYHEDESGDLVVMYAPEYTKDAYYIDIDDKDFPEFVEFED